MNSLAVAAFDQAAPDQFPRVLTEKGVQQGGVGAVHGMNFQQPAQDRQYFMNMPKIVGRKNTRGVGGQSQNVELTAEKHNRLRLWRANP
jgi:hypothetical protein